MASGGIDSLKSKTDQASSNITDTAAVQRRARHIPKMDLNKNTTNLTDVNVSAPIEVLNFDVSIYLVLASWLIAMWIIMSNSIIIFCFIVNRRRHWSTFSFIVLNLSISDLCVGLMAFPILIVSSDQTTDIKTGTCSVIFFLFFFGQCASLYHVFAVCLHRTLNIKSSSSRGPESRKRFPLVLSMSSWLFSGVVCCVPYIAWTEPNAVLTHCVIQQVFTNLRVAMGYMAVTYFLPQILTNVLYTIAFIRLRIIWSRVFPVGVAVDQTQDTVPSTSFYTRDTLNRLRVPTAFNGPTWNDYGEKVNLGQHHTHNMVIKVKHLTGNVNTGHSASSPATGEEVATVSTQATTTPTSGTSQRPGENPDHGYSRARVRLQRRVLGTIGLLMLIFDLFTIPIVIMMLYENQVGEIKRNTRFAGCCLFLLNSAINPFIYSLRTEWLRKYRRRVFAEWKHFCCS